MTTPSSDPARSRPVRVGVNLLWLVPGVVGGSEEYTVRLLAALAELDGDRPSIELYCRRDVIEAHPDLGDQFPVVVAGDVGSKGARILQEHTWLPRASRSVDVVHHGGGTVPVRRSAPAILTVHDPQPFDMPENFHPVKRRYLGWALPYSVAAAERIICPSRFTADRLVELFGVERDKLRVVAHGHRPLDRTSPDGEAVEQLRRRFGRFVLYPTIAYPHKRHVDLVSMLARLEPGLADVAVVFTGRPGPESQAVAQEAGRLGIGHRVHQLGRVPAIELEQLYRAAEALVFPSAYEGFGNPVLEAMTIGCPAVVSDAGALPEVLGDAGIVVPVGDVDAIAGAVTKILTSPDLAADLRRRGLARAEDFAPGLVARRLAAVYSERSADRQD